VKLISTKADINTKQCFDSILQGST